MTNTIKNQIDSIQILTKDIQNLNAKIDSLTLINRDLMVNKNYFSDVIDTQMDWFALIFVITFGLLGLAYWFGIIKYFKNKFTASNIEVKTTRNSLLTRMTQIDKTLQAKILSNYTILENKIVSLEKIQTELNSQKFAAIENDVKEIHNSMTEMISTTEQDIRKIIDDQKTDFDDEKESILVKLRSTNFDTQRSMFFSCYNDKSYSSALTWIVPMVEMIIEKEVEGFDLETFIFYIEDCISKVKLDNTITERFDYFNDKLTEFENKIEDVQHKERVKQIRLLLNKTYYENVKISIGTDKK